MQLNTSSFLKHFQAMMGPFGLYQHATGKVPLLSEGYCTDDNARAINVLLKLRREAPLSEHGLIDDLLQRCWRFVREAMGQAEGFENFRDASGSWLFHEPSEDMTARVMRACAALIKAGAPADRQQARHIISRLLPRVTRFTYVRSAAEGIIAVSELPLDQHTREVQSAATAQLSTLQQYWQRNASNAWPWFEPKVTYANALLPHGLLAAWRLKQPAEIAPLVHASTAFLVATTIRDEMFIPVGSVGWYSQGGTPSVDNQQPIEAGVTFDFLLEYAKSFPGRQAPEVIAAPYLWFFGKNTLARIVARPEEGASLDGLFLTGPNRNRGAESMLAYLWAELRLRDAPAAVTTYIAVEQERLKTAGVKS